MVTRSQVLVAGTRAAVAAATVLAVAAAIRSLRPLPAEAEQLLISLAAPPRLAAHLRIVHDVASDLTGMLTKRRPALVFDRDAVLYGAATHDIGKVAHINELSGPGSAHEHAGYTLLIRQGVPETLARFARTHASWTAPDVLLEDLLVGLAHKVWKAKRVEQLEALVVDRLTTATATDPWQAFMDLDDILTRLAVHADSRLAFQSSNPTR